MSRKLDLLFELGTEEIPSRFIPKALSDLEDISRKELEKEGLEFKSIKALGTPRRLALIVRGILERQADLILEILGPPKNVSLDENGRPKIALINFLKKYELDISSVKIKKKEKGEYVYAEKIEKGKEAKEILPSILSRLMSSLEFPRSMRWGEGDIRFARPIRWVVALLDGEILPMRVGELEANRFTRGHRFLTPVPIEIRNLEDYFKALRESYVILDPAERRRIIEEEGGKLAKEVGGEIRRDPELLEEVTYLVEYPYPLRGSFPAQYLSLPQEILISTLIEHQRYFPIISTDQSELLPYFLFVSNLFTPHPDTIIEGNERVIKARFADAEYFFNLDQKIPLADRAESLNGIVFQAQLGNLREKAERLILLGGHLSEILSPESIEEVKRAAFLCKTDLTTEMVTEYPSLQGVMGKIYCRLQGEKEEVAQAIYEHYLPLGAGKKIPQTPIGVILSIADKIDTIVGYFGIGLTPTGGEDPYALRRHTLGIINIVLQREMNLNLDDLISKSIDFYQEKLSRQRDDLLREVKEFFAQRLYYYLLSLGYKPDILDGVISGGLHDIKEATERIKVITLLKEDPDFYPFIIAYKRVTNILASKAGGEINEKLLAEYEERQLFQTYLDVSDKSEGYLKKKDYFAYLKELLRLKGTIDNFFDRVLVMTEDRVVRENRLSLLSKIQGLFLKVADFSKIVVEGS